MRLSNRESYALAWLLQNRGWDFGVSSKRAWRGAGVSYSSSYTIPADLQQSLLKKGFLRKGSIDVAPKDDPIGSMWMSAVFLTQEGKEAGEAALLLLQLEEPGLLKVKKEAMRRAKKK